MFEAAMADPENCLTVSVYEPDCEKVNAKSKYNIMTLSQQATGVKNDFHSSKFIAQQM